MNGAVCHISVQVWADGLGLCAAVYELYREIPPGHIQMVVFTTAFMQIIYSRAPKLGRYKQYGFLASRFQRTVSWSSHRKPLEVRPKTPRSEYWSCLCSSDPQRHDVGQEGCRLPRRTVQMERLALLWSLCVYWFPSVVRGTAAATRFWDMRLLALLGSALLRCLLLQQFSQVNSDNREREVVISHKYLFWLKEER